MFFGILVVFTMVTDYNKHKDFGNNIEKSYILIEIKIENNSEYIDESNF